MGKFYRKQILYSGWPQGVGLRFVVPDIARKFYLKGFVKNRPDGKVQIVVEGLGGDIDAFIFALDKKYDFLISPKEKEIKLLKMEGDMTTEGEGSVIYFL